MNKVLKNLRTYYGLEKEHMAEILCVSTDMLSGIEGDGEITLDILRKYSEEFDIPISNLFVMDDVINDRDPDSLGFLSGQSKPRSMLYWYWINSNASTGQP